MSTSVAEAAAATAAHITEQPRRPRQGRQPRVTVRDVVQRLDETDRRIQENFSRLDAELAVLTQNTLSPDEYNGVKHAVLALQDSTAAVRDQLQARTTSTDEVLQGIADAQLETEELLRDLQAKIAALNAGAEDLRQKLDDAHRQARGQKTVFDTQVGGMSVGHIVCGAMAAVLYVGTAKLAKDLLDLDLEVDKKMLMSAVIAGAGAYEAASAA